MEPEVEALKAKYPTGSRVRFIGFGEPDPWSPLPPGTEGTVQMVDDGGTVHVDWDSGSHLGMVLLPERLGGPGEPDKIALV